MNRVKLFHGDIAVIGGVRVSVDHAVTLSTENQIERVPAPGMTNLPDTDLHVWSLWSRQGRRIPMTTRQELRCPCGSVFVRRSATHHSC